MDTITVRYWVSTDKVGSECEGEETFDREEWDSMTLEEREEAMRDATFQCVNWGWEEDE